MTALLPLVRTMVGMRPVPTSLSFYPPPPTWCHCAVKFRGTPRQLQALHTFMDGPLLNFQAVLPIPADLAQQRRSEWMSQHWGSATPCDGSVKHQIIRIGEVEELTCRFRTLQQPPLLILKTLAERLNLDFTLHYLTDDHQQGGLLTRRAGEETSLHCSGSEFDDHPHLLTLIHDQFDTPLYH